MISFMISEVPANIRITRASRVQAADPILLHVAGAAVQLDAGVDHPAGELSREQFRLGGQFRAQTVPRCTSSTH